MKERALEEAKSLNYWFRQKYHLPPSDPRYLDMTDIEIEVEYMADLYRAVLDKGREPDLDEFETTDVDDAIDQWAEEDAEIIDAYDNRLDSDAWEEVTP